VAERLGGLGNEFLKPGLHETLLTRRLEELLERIADGTLVPDLDDLRDAEASDRVSRHLAGIVARAIDRAPEGKRSDEAVRIAGELIRRLELLADGEHDFELDELVDPARVLVALLRPLPDGRPEAIQRPLTPLLDTTVFTNAPGEPAVGHELRAEVPSADAIDVVMAFVRWSGVRPLLDTLRRHCEAGKPLRVLTTTYTNSTEQRALDELKRLGAEIKVSYDTSSTRLHAKAWIFHRESGYSTAYIGSSNLTQSAQVLGLEWNVRVSAARNPDAVAKMTAVFTSYWESRDFAAYHAAEFARRTEELAPADITLLGPIELALRPFQEALLEQVVLARHQGHHRNLVVAATGTGKTVIAAVDYARLRTELGRSRLLFVAHREEILDQSRATFRYALRDAAFGEKWVGGQRPSRFEHVFASIQSLHSSDVRKIAPAHFDVVIVDEFHHAAAPSYEALLEHMKPVELLGMTATPERADGLDVLRHFDGRIAAELRLWDAIDQEYLAPFAYFGIHDGLDLRAVPWRRGQGYDVVALENVLTADHAWARLVVEEVRRKVADSSKMRANASRSSVCPPSRSLQQAVGRSAVRRCVTSPTGRCAWSSPSTFSTRASTFRLSTRFCSFVPPTARRSSFNSSVAACGRRSARACARSSISSEHTAKSSASTDDSARCWEAHALTSNGRFAMGSRSSLPAAASISTRSPATSCSAASAPRSRAHGASAAPSFVRSAT